MESRKKRYAYYYFCRLRLSKRAYILIDSCWIQIEITMLTFVSDRVLVSVYAHDRKAQTITTQGLILAPRSKGQCDIFVYKILKIILKINFLYIKVFDLLMKIRFKLFSDLKKPHSFVNFTICSAQNQLTDGMTNLCNLMV